MSGSIRSTISPTTRENGRCGKFLCEVAFNAPHWLWEGPSNQAESKRLAGTSLRDFDGGTQKAYQRMIEAADLRVHRERFADTWSGKKATKVTRSGYAGSVTCCAARGLLACNVPPVRTIADGHKALSSSKSSSRPLADIAIREDVLDELQDSVPCLPFIIAHLVSPGCSPPGSPISPRRG
jgi:hypothetical protein